MWKLVLLSCALLSLGGCGYKLVGWSPKNWKTMEIRAVEGAGRDAGLKTRFRDALIERCLAGSGLTPVDTSGDLVLSTKLVSYKENVIATDVDGRTGRLQFILRADFSLSDKEGNKLWDLRNYQYTDQYSISTTQDIYRDESVFVQDEALRNIADLVITNITLAISELEVEDN